MNHIKLFEDFNNNFISEDEFFDKMNECLNDITLLNNVRFEDLNESELITEAGVASLIVSVMLSAPKIMSIIGGIINKIKKVFNKDAEPSKVAEWLVKKGGKLEHFYLKVIKMFLKRSRIPSLRDADGNIIESELDKAAHIAFYTILAAAAVSAGMTTVTELGKYFAKGGVAALGLGGLKGALATIKTKEILDGVKLLASHTTH